MSAIDRIWKIESEYKAFVKRISLIEIDDETIRLIFYFKDGTNLRIAEQWKKHELKKYSYYWLMADNS